MGVTTDLATNFDLVDATKQTVMSDERDFARPREDFYQSTAPSDLLQADDKPASFITQVKKFMKNNPLGPGYKGDVEDPNADPELLSLLKRFELALQIKSGKNVIGTIVAGNGVNPGGFSAALKLLKSPEADKIKSEEPGKTEVKPEDGIKGFQTFFGLPPTGIVDQKLIDAAKAAEAKIVQATNPGAKGLLWDDASKTFKTNLADLQQAMKLINEHQANKTPKSARTQAFLKLIKE